jgi:hypothetical protein
LVRIASRVAPMLGLVATMIPMGPALKGCPTATWPRCRDNLTVAFSAVILALIAAAITFWVANVRRRWLAEEMLQIEAGAPQAALERRTSPLPWPLKLLHEAGDRRSHPLGGQPDRHLPGHHRRAAAHGGAEPADECSASAT